MFTKRIGLIIAALGLICLLSVPALAVDRPLVVFANPASKDDAFFSLVTGFMQAAADDLGFELEVYYGDRNHVVIDENVKRIFNRQPLPDYIIGMNARGSGQLMVKQAEALGVKLVFINQSFLGKERVSMGLPGEKYKNWLFELLPNDVHSGYLLAKTLIDTRAAQLKPGAPIQLLAVNGHDESAASILRFQGVKLALAEYPNVTLNQEVHAMWKREKAYTYSRRLLERYPETSVIWAASDVMALGIVDAIRDSGKTPGKDVLTGGVDWASDGLTKVGSGEFSATVGGHFMDGGWALVMLYDRIHGVGVPNQSKSSFSVLTEKNIQDYVTHFGGNDWSKIDFRKFSKAINPKLYEYPFGLSGILEQVR